MTPKELMIVLVISLGSFMAGLDSTIVNIALPTIGKAFDISTMTVSWVLNAYLIVLVSLLLFASRLGDIRGFRKLFLTGFAIFTLGSALCGLATSLDILVFSRMLQAVGGAIISALGAVMVTTYLSSSLRGQALGMVAMFTMLGAALGPVLGGFLTNAFSWQFIFFVNLPVGILAILLGTYILPRADPITPNAAMDIPGVIIVFVALGMLIFGLNKLTGSTPMNGIILLFISAIFWVLFCFRERKTAEPLVNLKLFKNRAFTLQNVSIILTQLSLAGVMILMPFYLEKVLSVSTDNAGTILLALPVGMILTSPLAGRISDVIGTKKPIIIGFMVSILALFLLSTLSPNSSIGHVEIYLFMLGAGTGFAYAPLNSAVMGEASVKDRGATSGLIKMMSNLGSSLGVALVMLVTTVAAESKMAQTAVHTLSSTEMASAFDLGFFFLMCTVVLGIVLMLLVKEHDTEYSTEGEPVTPY
jgi:EmrB/QacA subfamily drug resistance transporter